MGFFPLSRIQTRHLLITNFDLTDSKLLVRWSSYSIKPKKVIELTTTFLNPVNLNLYNLNKLVNLEWNSNQRPQTRFDSRSSNNTFQIILHLRFREKRFYLFLDNCLNLSFFKNSSFTNLSEINSWNLFACHSILSTSFSEIKKSNYAMTNLKLKKSLNLEWVLPFHFFTKFPHNSN